MSDHQEAASELRPVIDMDVNLERTDSPSAATGSASASGSNSNSGSASASSNSRPRPKLQRGSRDVSTSRSPRPSNAFYDSSDPSTHDYASREASQSRSRSPPMPRESPAEDYSNISNIPGMSGIALAPTQLSYTSATGSGGSASVSGEGSGSGSSGSRNQQEQYEQRHQARSASQRRRQQAQSQSDDIASPIAPSPLLPQPSGFHFPRFGKSASTASFSTYAQQAQAQAQASGSRSRQPSNPYSSNSSSKQSIYRDLPSPRLHGDRDSDRGRDSGSEGRAGTSGGTGSLSGSSAWSFFRASSSSAAAKDPQISTRHFRSDSFSSSKGALTPILSPGTEEPGTGSVTPQVLTGGTTTPQGGGYADSEGISRMSRSPLGFELSRSAAFDRQQQNKHRRMSLSASFVINEGAASLAGSSYSSTSTSSSSHSAGSLSGSGFQTVSGRRRRERQMSVSAHTTGPTNASAPAINPSLDGSAATNKRKAEGLVAMAVRRTNTAENQKVVVAGRSRRWCF
jgi:hypothetical protein